jgi:hypothetical protein
MFTNAKILSSIIQRSCWSFLRISFTHPITPPKSGQRSHVKVWLCCWVLAIALSVGSNGIGNAQCSSSIPVTPVTATDETANVPASVQLVAGPNITVSTSTPGELIVTALTKFTLYSKSASFTASDGPGSFYRVSATATITLPASPGDGSIYKFKVTGGTSTFAFNGSDTINHAIGTSDQSLSLTGANGVLELIAVPGGWDET